MPILYGVALRGGEPVSGVQIQLFGKDDAAADETVTEDDGVFEFEVKPGLWKVKWTRPDGEPDEGEIEIVEGEDAELEIEV